VLCELFPDAPLYTLLWVKGSVSVTIENRPIHTSFIQRLPASAIRYRYYLPLFPLAVESFDLSGYDLVISSSHCVAKGVRVPDKTCHLSYIYTPMRYAWDQQEAYWKKVEVKTNSKVLNPWSSSLPSTLAFRLGMAVFGGYLRRWDRATADGPYRMAAISRTVADRIKRCYGREAEVIYPPVDRARFTRDRRMREFYLIVSAFAPYKRVELAIEACNRLQRPLKIIGSGQDEKRLKRLAGPTVGLLGWQPDHLVAEYYAGCRALLFPGLEDFGIVPLEAMAAGCPVIAYGEGGAAETIVPLGKASHKTLSPLGPCSLLTNSTDSTDQTKAFPTGLLFHPQTVEALMEAIRLFEKEEQRFDPETIRARTAPFDRSIFKQRMAAFIEESYESFRKATNGNRST
jgi:glycosyltransferase involved in cell wall biosynthesis